jgi:WD40 repeat protein
MTANTRDPQLMKSFREHKDRITQAIFTPNLKQIVSASTDGIVLATNLKANSRANKFQGHKGPVYGVSINPSNTLIASCSRDATIRIWNNNASAHS